MAREYVRRRLSRRMKRVLTWFPFCDELLREIGETVYNEIDMMG